MEPINLVRLDNQGGTHARPQRSPRSGTDAVQSTAPQPTKEKEGAARSPEAESRSVGINSELLEKIRQEVSNIVRGTRLEFEVQQAENQVVVRVYEKDSG